MTSKPALAYGTARQAGCRQRRLAGAATLAHNPRRWTGLLGLGTTRELLLAKTMRHTLPQMPGRLTRSARRWTLHLPAGWPWAPWFELALARLRCIPFPA